MRFPSVAQALPRIHLDNYSALPVDEGDEDRLAGVDDDECGYEGCELDLGEDEGDPGKTHRGLKGPIFRINDSYMYWLHFCFC